MDKQNLINKIYKLLPIYEGKLIDNKTLDREIAYDNFQKNLSLAIIEFNGINKICLNNKSIDNVLIILNGLQDIGINQKSKVKNAIFKCIKYIEEIDN